MDITLPLPPSVNALYNGGSGQQRFKSKKYKAWLVEAQAAIRKNLIADHIAEIGKMVVLHYIYYFPDKRSRDCENYVKAVSDFLVAQKIIEDDDCFHVPRMVIEFGGIDKNNPRVEICVEKASN